ncbi:MAG: thermonuclease family protein [Pirellulales bacterium]|nr:thermonuclease family protein [Pirellulales bacterium]
MPRFSLRRRKGTVVVLAILLLVAYRVWQDRQEAPPPEALTEEIYTVERVVDGDTLLLENRARVRLMGVDAPESVKPDHPVEPFGPEASQFTRDFVARGGNRVRLQFDKERVDQYGRFLAYVFVGDAMLNEELIRAGLATAETGYRFSPSVKTRFRRAEEEAKSARRGIWSREPSPANL